jgi:Icc-related predicted phosphoesterase
MKLYILSDLHTEFQRDRFVPPAEAVRDADIIVLAGDIGTGTNGMRWAAQAIMGKRIIYVAGNHEFYGHEWNELLVELRDLQSDLKVDFLENDVLHVGDVRFLGCTLWTDFNYCGPDARLMAMQAAATGMNDYHSIKHKTPASNAPGWKDGSMSWKPWRLSPQHSRDRHHKSVKWLQSELEKVLIHGDPAKTVVITHHLPHKECVAGRYRNDLLTAAFASDLSHLMGKSKLWIHGHTHDSVGIAVQGTRIIANPRGYPVSSMWAAGGVSTGVENDAFTPDLIHEV